MPAPEWDEDLAPAHAQALRFGELAKGRASSGEARCTRAAAHWSGAARAAERRPLPAPWQHPVFDYVIPQAAAEMTRHLEAIHRKKENERLYAMLRAATSSGASWWRPGEKPMPPHTSPKTPGGPLPVLPKAKGPQELLLRALQRVHEAEPPPAEEEEAAQLRPRKTLMTAVFHKELTQPVQPGTGAAPEKAGEGESEMEKQQRLKRSKSESKKMRRAQTKSSLATDLGVDGPESKGRPQGHITSISKVRAQGKHWHSLTQQHVHPAKARNLPDLKKVDKKVLHGVKGAYGGFQKKMTEPAEDMEQSAARHQESELFFKRVIKKHALPPAVTDVLREAFNKLGGAKNHLLQVDLDDVLEFVREPKGLNARFEKRAKDKWHPMVLHEDPEAVVIEAWPKFAPHDTVGLDGFVGVLRACGFTCDAPPEPEPPAPSTPQSARTAGSPASPVKAGL